MEMNGAHTVFSVFKALGARTQPNVRLTKLKRASSHNSKVEVGQVIEGTLNSNIAVGLSFNIKNATVLSMIAGYSITPGQGSGLKGIEYKLWCTSIIQEVLSENTFRTKNSIYKWEVIE